MIAQATTPPATAFVRGVEAPLPAGERVLWQGAPRAGALARHAFHVRKVLAYFGGLMLVAAVFAAQSARPLPTFASSALWLCISATVAAGFAGLVSVLTTRATTYAITNRRIVMRTGIALPVVLNIPLRLIDAVDLRQRPGGTGDIALRLGGDVRVAYLVLWPHVRAWRIRHPEPLFRGLPDAADVGAVLNAALRAQDDATTGHAPGGAAATPDTSDRSHRSDAAECAA